MATANSINANQAGIIRYDGMGTFSGLSVTNHNILTGAASNGITSVAPSATTGIPLVSNGAAADPSFTTALVVGGGTGSVSFNTNGVLISGTSGTDAITSLSLTSGQVVIGGTTTPAAATLTGGTGVSISNGNNSITINATGGGVTWTDVTGTSQGMSVNNGYLADNAGLVTLTLPATAAQFSVIHVQGFGAGGWTIAQNAGQQIVFGSSSTTVGIGGSLSSTNKNDAISLLAVVGGASTVWVGQNAVGNLTVV